MIKGRPPRLPEIFQSIGEPLYFVTMCTLHRRKFFSLQIVEEAFTQHARRGISEFNVGVGRYVIMADHLHLFVRGDAEFVLGEWIKGLKRAIAMALPEHARKDLWQPGFFDHVLRSDESYGEKWNYVRENPVRAGLVKDAADWPYQGEIVSIDRA